MEKTGFSARVPNTTHVENLKPIHQAPERTSFGEEALLSAWPNCEQTLLGSHERRKLEGERLRAILNQFYGRQV
jgi:hypothetical protein